MPDKLYGHHFPDYAGKCTEQKKMSFPARTAVVLIFIMTAMTLSEAETGGIFRKSFVRITDKNEILPCNEYKITKNQWEKNQFVLFFQPIKNAYLYLLLFNPDDTVNILFPCTPEEYDINYLYAKKYYPEKEGWKKYFKCTGNYRLSILISAERLNDLEKSLNEYQSEEKDKKKEIFWEIRKLTDSLKLDFYLEGEVQRKAVEIMGNFRTAEKNIPNFSEQIQFDKIYVKTYYFENEQ